MHERAIVKSLLDLVNKEVNSRQLMNVRDIQVEIGEFSGVEPALVAIAFDEMAAECWPNRVNLQIRVAPLLAFCQECVRDFPVEQFQFVCPICGARDVRVTSGEEIRVMNIIAER